MRPARRSTGPPGMPRKPWRTARTWTFLPRLSSRRCCGISRTRAADRCLDSWPRSALARPSVKPRRSRRSRRVSHHGARLAGTIVPVDGHDHPAACDRPRCRRAEGTRARPVRPRWRQCLRGVPPGRQARRRTRSPGPRDLLGEGDDGVLVQCVLHRIRPLVQDPGAGPMGRQWRLPLAPTWHAPVNGQKQKAVPGAGRVRVRARARRRHWACCAEPRCPGVSRRRTTGT
jgi:hypothetical protein